MKGFAVFMTILILLTGFDLCADESVCEPVTTAELTGAGKANPENYTACSPFCTCTRCPFSVLVPQKTGTAYLAAAQTGIFSYVNLANPIQVVSAIWQPPKSA